MRKIIRFLATNPVTWPLFKIMHRFTNRFVFERELIGIEQRQLKHQKQEEALKKKFENLYVQNGLFKGMEYPSFTAMGSSIYSKLVGSYESELFPIMERVLRTPYEIIIDVGCAEGYYAVGLALKMPSAKVYAYDINPMALQQCKKMAMINNVESRMVFEERCSPNTLQNFDFSKRSLIVCDCEGYELELFNEENLPNLKKCDILIELHDLYNEEISYRLHQLFSKTHHLEYIYSENTFKRFEKLDLLNAFSLSEIKNFFTERNGIMQWVFITPLA